MHARPSFPNKAGKQHNLSRRWLIVEVIATALLLVVIVEVAILITLVFSEW
jgi:hypothetical protein